MRLRKPYLFFVSFVSLLLFLFASMVLLDHALKIWVFPLGDQPNYAYPCMTPASPEGKPVLCDQAAIDAQRKIDQAEHAAQSNPLPAIIALIIAGPIWWIHWRLAQKEA